MFQLLDRNTQADKSKEVKETEKVGWLQVYNIPETTWD